MAPTPILHIMRISFFLWVHPHVIHGKPGPQGLLLGLRGSILTPVLCFVKAIAISAVHPLGPGSGRFWCQPSLSHLLKQQSLLCHLPKARLGADSRIQVRQSQ